MTDPDDLHRRRLDQLALDDDPRRDTPAQRAARLQLAKAQRRAEAPDGMRRAVTQR